MTRLSLELGLSTLVVALCDALLGIGEEGPGVDPDG